MTNLLTIQYIASTGHSHLQGLRSYDIAEFEDAMEESSVALSIEEGTYSSLFAQVLIDELYTYDAH